MKAMVLGASGIGNQIAATLAAHIASKNIEVVTIDSLNDANHGDGDVLIVDDYSEISKRLIVHCGHPLANIGVNLYPEAIEIPERDNSFRGGSRGKGGKIKYRRK